MKTIYKYQFSVNDEVRVPMPSHPEILSVQSVPGTPDALNLWAMIDTDQQVEDRLIKVFGTGHPADRLLPLDRYLATVVVAGGALVWHVFDGGIA